MLSVTSAPSPLISFQGRYSSLFHQFMNACSFSHSWMTNMSPRFCSPILPPPSTDEKTALHPSDWQIFGRCGGKTGCFHTASTPKKRIIFDINSSLLLFNDKPWSTFQLEITFSEFFFVLYLHPPPGGIHFFVIF